MKCIGDLIVTLSVVSYVMLMAHNKQRLVNINGYDSRSQFSTTCVRAKPESFLMY